MNVINMCGFDSGLGKEINESILGGFPSSLEIAFVDGDVVTLSGIVADKKSVFKNELRRWEIQKPGKSETLSMDNKSLLNVMYFQMLLAQNNIERLPMENCKFIFKSEEDETIQHGIELLFIHSLVYIQRKPSSLKLSEKSPIEPGLADLEDCSYQGEFGFVINFDGKFVHVLTPFAFCSPNESRFEILKSAQICLDLDQQVLAQMKSPNSNSEEPENLPFKGLKLSKKISTKLRKKISKRKNTRRKTN